MKQKDVIVIIVVAIFSAILSFLLSSKLFISPAKRQQNVQTIDKISATFNLPDSRFFNDKSINPTINSNLGDSTNTTPFNGGE